MQPYLRFSLILSSASIKNPLEAITGIFNHFYLSIAKEIMFVLLEPVSYSEVGS